MDITYEIFTPDVAMATINKHNGDNRKLRPGVVKSYATNMRNGTWTECADPIVFSTDGELMSGQHRLHAIVESGSSQAFIVIRNFPVSAGLNIDTQLPRTFLDNAKFAGISDVSTTLMGIARGIEIGSAPWTKAAVARLSMADRVALVEKHRTAATWAMAHLPRSKSSLIPVIAVARAYYVEKDEAHLRRFCEVFKTGRYDNPSELAAITLRNWVMTTRNYSRSAEWGPSFKKVQNAIWYFMRREPLQVIRSISEERYPLAPTQGTIGA